MIRRELENDEDEETVRMTGSEVRAMLANDTPTTAGLRDHAPVAVDGSLEDPVVRATPETAALRSVDPVAREFEVAWILAGATFMAIAVSALVALAFL
ncbi:MAG: hypothetical protein H6738_23140 [Alphaproteobacteria bacterium]|nr:hypothetical protein [Alphaproteobacteria bacterium]MCB9699700.1 hypothetical protein [Alphaproteobacteria bacterium]